MFSCRLLPIIGKYSSTATFSCFPGLSLTRISSTVSTTRIDSSVSPTKLPTPSQSNMTFNYPIARRDDSVKETHFGIEIADPYRWLEDPDSDETRAFVDAQNGITMPYLRDTPGREILLATLTKNWDYPKYSCPYRHGSRYFFYKNTGLQNQSVLYVQDGLEGEPRVFLDQNLLSSDGTIAMSQTAFSNDENTMAYTLSKSGSDWVTIHFRDVATANDLPDVLEKIKFTSMAWTHDEKGIFYTRYPDTEGKSDGSETTSNTNNKLYYHVMGNKQSDDTLCVEFPGEPNYMIGAEVSDCGRWLLVCPRKLCKDNLLYFCDLQALPNGIDGQLPLTEIVGEFEADYEYITNEGPEFFFRTNKDAQNYKVIKINFENPQRENWVTFVPEHKTDVLNWATAVANDKLVLCYIHNVKSVLYVHSLKTGNFLKQLPLPIGTVTGFSGKKKYPEIFFQVASFLVPGIIYKCDFTKEPPEEPKVYREIKLPGFDASQFYQKQVFYPSKDGTKIPMFIVHKKGVKQTGDNACLLYGYGGFNHALQPGFGISWLTWTGTLGGVLAVANLRGGGEYGERWHDGGRLLNKQNTFDDVQSAAEYLIAEKYTNKERIAIQGGSNGGLVVAACLNQRPDLFKAGIIQVGVLDMLRYHKFTIGAMWISDYGSPDEEKNFKNLFKFSPLHNIPLPEDQYPATLLLTADHDDRVVPLHSLKFIATLQYKLGSRPQQVNPLLIRLETKAGHGGGKPTTKTIEEQTDIFCFLMKNLGITFSS